LQRAFHDEKGTDKISGILPEANFAVVAAQLPFYAYLLGIRAGGAGEIRRSQRDMVGAPAVFEMSPVS
jgi:hypothetical protein